jgi:hypothetical protein
MISAAFTGGNLYTQRQALHANQDAAAESQRTALFSQFQQQYNTVRAGFPERFMDPKFRPAAGTDDYARLQAYWFFCFSEWYATHRVNAAAFGSLWADYYSPLIGDGLSIPSLRYVLEDRIRTRGVGSGDWTAFLKEVAAIASAHRRPLSKDVQEQIATTTTAQLDVTDVSFASTAAKNKISR